MVKLFVHNNRCVGLSRDKKEHDIIDTAISVYGISGFLNKCVYIMSNEDRIAYEYTAIINGEHRKICVLVVFGDDIRESFEDFFESCTSIHNE